MLVNEPAESAIVKFLQDAAEEVDATERGKLFNKLDPNIKTIALACLIRVYYRDKQLWSEAELERAFSLLLGLEYDLFEPVRRLKAAKLYQRNHKKSEGRFHLTARESGFTLGLHPQKTVPLSPKEEPLAEDEEVWPPSLPFGLRSNLLAEVLRIDELRQQIEDVISHIDRARQNIEVKLRAGETSPDEREASELYLSQLVRGLQQRLERLLH